MANAVSATSAAVLSECTRDCTRACKTRETRIGTTQKEDGECAACLNSSNRAVGQVPLIIKELSDRSLARRLARKFVRVQRGNAFDIEWVADARNVENIHYVGNAVVEANAHLE